MYSGYNSGYNDVQHVLLPVCPIFTTWADRHRASSSICQPNGEHGDLHGDRHSMDWTGHLRGLYTSRGIHCTRLLQPIDISITPLSFPWTQRVLHTTSASRPRIIFNASMVSRAWSGNRWKIGSDQLPDLISKIRIGEVSIH